MKGWFLAPIAALLFASCSSSPTYKADAPVGPAAFHSRDNSIVGLLPAGWFAATGDSVSPLIQAFLLKDDFSAAILFREILPDPLTKAWIADEGLALLAEITMGFHAAAGADTRPLPVEEFELRDRPFCEYEPADSAGRSRVVVFSAGGRFYECEARAMRGAWNEEQLRDLFTTQQSVLASLTEADSSAP